MLQKEVPASPKIRIQTVAGIVHANSAPRPVALLHLTGTYPVNGSLEIARRLGTQKYLERHEVVVRDAINCHWRTRPHQVRRYEAIFTSRFPYLNGFSN